MLKRITFICCIAALFVSSTTIFAQDPPDSIQRSPLELTRYYEEQLRASTLPAEEFVAYLAKLNETLFEVSAEQFDLGPITREQWTEVFQRMWNIRVLLHDKIRQFFNEGKLQDTMGNQNREYVDVFRLSMKTLRGVKDYFLEIAESQHGDFPTKGKKYLPVFGGGNWYTQREAGTNFSLNNLRSGDLILTMSTSSVSGFISRVGAYDTDFSHAAVFIETKGGSVGS